MVRWLLTVSTSLDKRLSEGQPKASSSASDDEDAVVQLRTVSAQLDDKSTSKETHLEFSEAVRWLHICR
jgi:hypothetical protein